MTEYADRDPLALGEHYTRHLSAMTDEELFDKAGIAAELAWRDQQIEELKLSLENFVEAASESLVNVIVPNLRAVIEKRLGSLQRQLDTE